MNTQVTVSFAGQPCQLSFARYGNGRIALRLFTQEGPMATATVNVPCHPLGPNEVLIKDFAENRGVLEALVEAGVVRRTGAVCRVGHAEAHVCDLLIEPADLH